MMNQTGNDTLSTPTSTPTSTDAFRSRREDESPILYMIDMADWQLARESIMEQARR